MPGQKLPALAQAFLVDAVADAGRDVPFGRDVQGGEPLRGLEKRRHRDEFVRSAMMVPWLKPTSASAEGGSWRRCNSASKKPLSAGAAALTPTQRSFGSRNVKANH